MREAQFATGNLSLSYTMSEAEGLPLVLLHGLSFGRRAYSPLIEALPSSFQTFALDFRGHGQSARVRAPYLFADLVKDTKSFLQQCVRQPAYIFGHSLGGGVGLAAASVAPESVRGLIVCDNFLSKKGHLSLTEQPSLRRLLQGLREIVLLKLGPKDLVYRLANIRLPVPGADEEIRLGDFPGNTPEFLQMWAECLAAWDPEAVSLFFAEKNLAAFAGERYLRHLRCPLLLMQANPELGGVLSDEDIAVAKAIKADVEVCSFPDADHFLPVRDPVLPIEGITDFVTHTEQRSARDD